MKKIKRRRKRRKQDSFHILFLFLFDWQHFECKHKECAKYKPNVHFVRCLFLFAATINSFLYSYYLLLCGCFFSLPSSIYHFSFVQHLVWWSSKIKKKNLLSFQTNQRNKNWFFGPRDYSDLFSWKKQSSTPFRPKLLQGWISFTFSTFFEANFRFIWLKLFIAINVPTPNRIYLRPVLTQYVQFSSFSYCFFFCQLN